MKASEMTIEEAIRHAEEVAQRKCDECGNQHQQLANWLKELVALRSKLKVAEDARPVPASPNICDKANLVIREFEKVATRRPDGLTVIDCECSRLECAVEELKEALVETSCEGRR